MELSCSIIPQIKDKKGNLRDSKLFKDLQDISDVRKTAVNAYLVTKNPEFIDKYKSKLKYDDLNEPTIGSLMGISKFKDYIGTSTILNRLNNTIGKTSKNFDDLYNDAVQFNSTNALGNKFVANIYQDGDNYQLRVEEANQTTVKRYNDMQKQHLLNGRLRQILSSNGISIGYLSEAERRLGIDGVTEFNTAQKTAEGTIQLIRISKGFKGEQALPEEFAHAAIAGIDSPLITRSLQQIKATGAYKEILGEEYSSYAKAYNNNEDLLAEEALGRLLAQQLNNQSSAQTKQPLFRRLLDKVKSVFRKLSESDIKQAIADSDQNMSELAKSILTGDTEIRVKQRKARLYKIKKAEEEIKNINTLLGRVFQNEYKRYNIFKNSQSASEKSKVTMQQQLEQLNKRLEANDQKQGLVDWATNAVNMLTQLSERLDKQEDDPNTSINEQAKLLGKIRLFMRSYVKSLDDVQRTLERADYKDEAGQKLHDLLGQITMLAKQLDNDYYRKARPLFEQFIKPFISQKMIDAYKAKGIDISAKSILDTADKDISFWERWLDAMGDSSNVMLKVFDDIVKTTKEHARLKTINDQKMLIAAAKELEEAGVTDYSWLYERDAEGHKTGRFVSPINWSKYYQDKREFFKYMRRKYGDKPDASNPNFKAWNAEWSNWFKAHTTDGKTPNASYNNSDFPSGDDPQSKAKLKFWKTLMEFKNSLDEKLPDKIGGNRFRNIPVIRKDAIERIMSNGITNAPKAWWENFKDSLVRRSDDTGQAYSKNVVLDFDNNEVDYLPLYYTSKAKGESWDDISEDPISTMVAYAAMANDYAAMNDVIDTLELGRQVVRENLDVNQNEGNREKYSWLRIGNKSLKQRVSKSGDDTRIMQRLNDFFKMQVYQRYMDDNGTMKIPGTNTEIDINKLASKIQGLTALNSMALNVLSGINNVATGSVMMRIESFAHEYFSERDTITADKNYAASMPAYIAQIGSRVKTNKLALWEELFNTEDEYENAVKELNWDQKNVIIRLFGKKAVYFLNNIGEHWMHNRTSLALANRYKLKDSQGNEISLWDAMIVKNVDDKHPEYGAKLVLKDGVTKLDGSKFTDEDIIAFTRKTHAINNRLHGIYNQADMNAFQALAIGRMAMMFRKYMRPSWNRRFGKGQYNMDLDEWVEGYYRTTGRFMTQLYKELRQGQLDIVGSYHKLNATERANIVRALTEVGHFAVVCAAIGLLSSVEPKNRTWLEKQMLYQALRLKADLGTFLPAPTMLTEGLKLVNSPIPSINTMQGTIDLINLMNPFAANKNFEFIGGENAILQSGTWKGYSRAQKVFLKSPLAPFYRQLKYFSQPEDLIDYFQNGGF